MVLCGWFSLQCLYAVVRFINAVPSSASDTKQPIRFTTTSQLCQAKSELIQFSAYPPAGL